MSDSGTHHPTAIVVGEAIGQYLGHGIPVEGREVLQDAVTHLAGCVFQPRCRPAEFFERASAASRSASSNTSQRSIKSPSSVKS